MAEGIVKYAYDRSSQLISIIWLAVSCRGLRSIYDLIWKSTMISPVITSPKTIPYCKTKFEDKKDTQLPLTTRSLNSWYS